MLIDRGRATNGYRLGALKGSQSFVRGTEIQFVSKRYSLILIDMYIQRPLNTSLLVQLMERCSDAVTSIAAIITGYGFLGASATCPFYILTTNQSDENSLQQSMQ